jgi:hypothetical protein
MGEACGKYAKINCRTKASFAAREAERSISSIYALLCTRGATKVDRLTQTCRAKIHAIQ